MNFQELSGNVCAMVRTSTSHPPHCPALHVDVDIIRHAEAIQVGLACFCHDYMLRHEVALVSHEGEAGRHAVAAALESAARFRRQHRQRRWPGSWRSQLQSQCIALALCSYHICYTAFRALPAFHLHSDQLL